MGSGCVVFGLQEGLRHGVTYEADGKTTKIWNKGKTVGVDQGLSDAKKIKSGCSGKLLQLERCAEWGAAGLGIGAASLSHLCE